MSEALLVSLVRPPIVSTTRAFNNEATPCIGFAYISGFLQSKGYQVKIVDDIAEALNRSWDIPEFPGYHCQGLTIDEIIERIDPHSHIIGYLRSLPHRQEFFRSRRRSLSRCHRHVRRSGAEPHP
jgi:hypothetical protein